MKKYEERTIPSKTQKVCTAVVCDICHKTHTSKLGSSKWEKDSSFEIQETTVEMQTGCRYPEGGSAELTTFDICPACFETKLIPWVESFGGEGPTIREVEY